ncbi:pseudaminic acid cytidylyltransferase [Geobacter sp.]|uniref:pseudaminic acid cytidylyltransferase n=1 Tax=Geobacter sp. TaxID=46610 RepID=UPI0027BA5678|nr:pseudaminic acid cytidylyltransferase [Geobacter sp.]
MNVAIIPARGGSKRIPRKNIKPFAGKPMIAHSIFAARESGLFERVIVSTDDEEIAHVSRDHGAEVPFMRPAELADDFAGTDAVLLHALKWLEERGELPAAFCCIYATAPFVRSDYLRQGLEALRREEATTAFSVTTFAYSIFRALRTTANGRLEMIWPENRDRRSQDLGEACHDAGQFYWADTGRYLEERRLFSRDAVPVFIPRHLVQDIDTPEDWETAERMYRALFP